MVSTKKLLKQSAAVFLKKFSFAFKGISDIFKYINVFQM